MISTGRIVGEARFVENECRAGSIRSVHASRMRRLTTILMAFALLASWSAPLLATISSSSVRNLPACCRKGGKHHCVAMMAMRSFAGTVISAPIEKCPFFPKAGVLPGTMRIGPFRLPSGILFYHQASSCAAVVAQTEARYRISCDRSRLKRGPPAIV